MESNNQKVNKLVESSKQVLLNCCLENGAIVAANTDHPAYPINANNYRFVWPRDAAFIIYSLDILGIDKRASFSRWLIDRAEQAKHRGIFYRRYQTNGSSAWPDESFQPDQSGALLWALTNKPINDDPAIIEAIEITANGITKLWDTDSFIVQVHDLWEHMSMPPRSNTFLYSLAACSSGLALAAERLSYSEHAASWLQAANQMRDVVLRNTNQGLPVTRLGAAQSNNMDASILGLAWPFGVGINQDQIDVTVENIEDELAGQTGLHRFKDDTYDGLIRASIDDNKGAGSWPLLTFWLSIAQNQQGDTQKSKETFENLVTILPDNLIPEQIFDDTRVGIQPLGWSHAMFIIAAQKLGYLS